MARRRLLVGLVILVCCLVTNRMTWWLARAELKEDFHEAVDFHRYGSAFEAFLSDHPIRDGEQINGDRLPPSLATFGIANVYRNGRLVYFVLPHTSFLADDSTSEFIRNLDHTGGVVEEVLSKFRGNTYHIQYMRSVPGWYFWEHN